MTTAEQLAAALDAATEGLGMQMEEPPPPYTSVSDRRRARHTPYTRLSTLTITDVDGVLRIETARATSGMAGRRHRRGPALGLGGQVVRTFRFEEVPPADLGTFLGTLDQKLNPEKGLRELRWSENGAVLGEPAPFDAGRTLLLVHGAFGKSEWIVDALRATEPGRAFLRTITTPPSDGGQYARVLVYDHATLALSPLQNAYDLALATQGLSGPIDVIGHGRGGLVCRWWMSGFTPPIGDGRVVYVGAPLAGTSFAAPIRLREAMEMLANVGRAFRATPTLAATSDSLLTVSTGLIKVVTSLTSLTTRMPLLDAAMAMIPGLLAQGSAESLFAMQRLRPTTGEAPPRWFAIRASFEPEPTGWRFLKRFALVGLDSADGTGDQIFGDANDLLVDSRSMTALGDAMQIPPERTLDFASSGVVHHWNYFEQPETVRFLGDVFRDTR